MTIDALPRPAADEHAPYYARYVQLVPDGNLLDTLERQLEEFLLFTGSLSESVGHHAYAPGKWTVKEVLGHIIDAERIFAYRALRIARGDETPLPGFDENTYAPASGANQRTIPDLAEEFAHVRRATIALLRPLTPEAAARRGTASNNPASTRAIAWIIAGHLSHHLGVLRERYLAA